jgi:hypothetical protein
MENSELVVELGKLLWPCTTLGRAFEGRRLAQRFDAPPGYQVLSAPAGEVRACRAASMLRWAPTHRAADLTEPALHPAQVNVTPGGEVASTGIHLFRVTPGSGKINISDQFNRFFRL